MGQAALTLVAALLLAPRQPESPATPQPGVSVSFRDCETNPVGKSVFLGALALELDLHSTESHEPLGATEIDVELGCDGIAQIQLRVGVSARERAVRFDDVAPQQRARALALVTAELVRSAARESGPGLGTAAGAKEGSAADRALPDGAATTAAGVSAATAAAARPPEPKAAAPSPDVADVAEKPVEPERERARRALRVVAGGALRFTPAAPLWGGDVGVELPFVRALAELLMVKSNVERGSITSGIGSLRIGKSFELARAGALGFGAGASVAGGVTWSVGSSSVPGTTVQEILKPYFDGEVELAARYAAAPRFEPELMLFAGRATGIQATSDAVVEQATGGWFAGLRLGALF